MPSKAYDWDDWFSKRRFVLRRGEHYVCSQSSMSQQIRNAAHVRSLRIVLLDQDDQFVVIVKSPEVAASGS